MARQITLLLTPARRAFRETPSRPALPVRPRRKGRSPSSAASATDAGTGASCPMIPLRAPGSSIPRLCPRMASQCRWPPAASSRPSSKSSETEPSPSWGGPCSRAARKSSLGADSLARPPLDPGHVHPRRAARKLRDIQRNWRAHCHDQDGCNRRMALIEEELLMCPAGR